ncbi:uncharacterized protein EAF01_001496 [Botrytis porri]|uniref:uncharacterized protein n=1 Tax=Botrytis porri TaxID=87229 RepID=UPI0019007AEE|nr:uncharacterized protein EAF01_001496 [Botrytis porri]KAF7912475.1 hypothetical protein EAF01_001496 [Botrytis porri]
MEVDFDAPLSNNARHTAPCEHYLFALREYSKILRLARRNTNEILEVDRQEAFIKTVVSGLKIISSVREQHILKNTHSIW